MSSSLRNLTLALLTLPFGIANANHGPSDANIIPNGDFSQGNVGFTSALPYAKPEFNCLWGGYYTVASTFNRPPLHKLIAIDSFPSAVKKTGNEKVFYANAGGTEPLVVWQSTVKCQPKTRYLITFNVVSLSGHVEYGDPPKQVPTAEWVPEFEIWANSQISPPFEAGCGTYYKAKMVWDSAKETSAIIKIVRTKFPHGGGLIGISNIEMVPIKVAPKSDGS